MSCNIFKENIEKVGQFMVNLFVSAKTSVGEIINIGEIHFLVIEILKERIILTETGNKKFLARLKVVSW